MLGFLRQSTASQTVSIGPFLDRTDFVTAENALTIANTDIKLKKNGGASASKNSGGASADGTNGMYHCTFDATDSATVGQVQVTVDVAGALPWHGYFVVLEEPVYDAMFASGALGFLQPTIAGRTLDVTNTGAAGIDWANIENPTTAVNLSGTNIDVDQVVASVSGNVGGNVSGSVGTVAPGGITAESIATGAIDADALAADAVAEIADGVWDEAISGHLTAGSTGNALNAAGSAGDPWSTALPGAYGAGTAGKIVGDNINATISSRASQTSVDTIDDFLDTEIAAIKTKTDNLPTDPADQSAVEAAITTATSGLATAANLATVAGYLDTEIAAILADTNEMQTDLANGGRLDLLIDAIKAKTDNLPTDPADQSAVEAAITAAQVALVAEHDATQVTLGTVNTNVSTLLTRITSTLFSGITSLGDWLRRLARKDSGTAGMIAAEAEIDTGGTSTFSGITDNLEYISENGGGGGGGASAAAIDALLSANHGAGSWATGGTVVRLAKPIWTANGFDRPLTRGDDYSIAGLGLEVTVENWTGPDFDTASAITLTAKLTVDGVLTDTFTCDSTSATESGTTWTILFQPTSTDTDVTAGVYEMDIQATFAGKPYTFVGPGVPLTIKQDQTV